MVQIFIGAILISFSSVFVKLVHVGPTSSMFYRFFFGALALFLAALITKTPLFRDFKSFCYAGLAGFIFSLDLFFWHRSILFVGPGLATILANFQVFILTLIGLVFLGERLRVLFIFSVILAFSGLTLLIGLDFQSMDRLFQRGIIYGLLTACCYSGVTLTIQKSQKLSVRLGPISNMAWLCLFGSVLGSFGVMISGESFIIPDIESLLYLMAYGVICSGIGWYFITKGLPRVSVSLAGLSLTLQPTFAFLWDVLFFAKPVTIQNLVGAVITFFAIYLGTVSRSR
ncbi:DMT family transporter [Thermodesulfobacteriota bacterium]